jgi:kumamolisin
MKEILRRGALVAALLIGMPALATPITVTLSLKGKMSMEELARSVRDPLSSHYGRFYEPAEIRQLAGPDEAEYNRLIEGLQEEGMTVVQESPTHLWLTIKGEHRVFESLFSTRLQMDGGKRIALFQAQVPGHLALVKSVAGLDNTRESHPRYRRLDGNGVTFGRGVDQATIKTGYGFDPIYQSGISGQGTHIAIATYMGFNIRNVQEFYRQSILRPMPTVDQVKFNGVPVYDENSAGETELDAEFSGMIAPGASVHVFASAENSDAGELALFTAILDDNRAKVVNYSWGDCESHVSAQHRDEMAAVFARAAAQGVNILAASGDSGSDSCQDGTTQADWPSANPNVVSVGGTSFYGSSKGMTSENGWSGSGGGISGMWDLPVWQQQLGGQFVKRSYPDVSFNADPMTGQAIYTGQNPSWIVVGGTSMAAPQWAGFLALVEQARATAGKGTLGFLNPVIYAMTGDEHASAFNDVTSGSNGAYSCAGGWDAVTGWGSMKADALLNYLKNY